MITGEHWHVATGHDSVNRGKFYLCQNKGKDKKYGCCVSPAYTNDEFPDEIAL